MSTQTIPNAGKKLWGNLRVSTKRQKNEGDSIETQEAMIRQWCAMHGHELLGFVEDVGTATKNIMQRPGMAKLMKIAKAGEADGFICYKLDRMFRNTIEGLQVADSFTALGFSMFFADLGGNAADVTTARGRRIFAYDLIDAEVESMRIGERVKAVSEDKKARGKQHCANPPYGWMYKKGERLSSPKERAGLKHMWRCFYGLGMSLSETTASMDDSPHKTRKGRKLWSKSTVKAVLENTVNQDLFKKWQQEHDANHSGGDSASATGISEDNSHE